MKAPSAPLRALLLITDLGFLLYWSVTALHLLPASLLFKDYANPILVAWNWSFLPLDLGASFLGLAALHLARKGRPQWHFAALLSLTLTACAGLMALSFWTLRSDYDPLWWAPNAFLLVWPLFFLKQLRD
jgi:hypothetical protein